MKKKILKLSLLVFFLILFAFPSMAQGCNYQESVPDELLRKRHKPAAMVYGNPYTMFDYNWQLTISKIYYQKPKTKYSELMLRQAQQPTITQTKYFELKTISTTIF